MLTSYEKAKKIVESLQNNEGSNNDFFLKIDDFLKNNA